MSDQVPPSVPRWLSGAAAVSWRLLVVAAALVMAGLALKRLEVLVVPVMAALFLTTVLGPPATWLRRRGVPGLLATWIVLLVAAAVVTGIIFGLVPTVESEFARLGRTLGTGITRTEGWLVHGPLHLSQARVSASFDRVVNFLNSHRQAVISGALTGVHLAASVLAGILLTIVLTFFFVNDGQRITSWAIGLFPERQRQDAHALVERSWRVLTGYIRGTAINGLVNAAVLSLTLLGLGVPFVVPVALLTFVGAFLPVVGAIISGLLAALVALVSNGPLAAAIVIGATILAHNLEGYLVGPWVVGRAVRLHPVAVLLVLGVGTILGGVIGAFLAVPVTAVVAAIAHYYRAGRDAPFPPERPRRRRQQANGAGGEELPEVARPGPAPR
ncbi:MAG TPA: AI-2E family transporter [Acidimicrobiales bacterium]|nr:AI-2E family transporter [Acidimicrobiales bacterium]